MNNYQQDAITAQYSSLSTYKVSNERS